MLAARLAHGQPPPTGRIRTIGIVNFIQDPALPPDRDPTHILLAKRGWIEGQNLVIERRWANLKIDRLPGLVQELIDKQVEVIYADGSEASLAAARATKTIPIVFAGVPFPIEQGLVQSLARPGGNVTGTSTIELGVSMKRLEFIRDIAPSAKRVFHIYTVGETDTVAGGRYDIWSQQEKEAKHLGFEYRAQHVGTDGDINVALSEAVAWRADALSVAAAPVTIAARRPIIEFALRQRLLCASPLFLFAEEGALFSYGMPYAEFAHLLDRSIGYIDRILRGEKPAELPVEQPRRYELIVNLQTARALGLSIPRSILLRADRVIE